MEITIEELLKQMLNFFQNVDKELKKAYEDLSDIDQRQSDLLHYIEAMPLNAGGYAKAGKMLKSVRQKRRIIKNTIERLKRIQTFTTKYNNKMIQGDLIQTIKDLKEIDKKQDEPMYTTRTNILEELITQDEQIQKQEDRN